MNTAECLDAAARFLSDHEHAKHNYIIDVSGAPSGTWYASQQPQTVRACCVIGAIRCVAGLFDFGLGDRAKQTLASHLGVTNLADWNDAPERTKEQVIAALSAAALEATP
jgi:hypothetical protein